MHCAACETLITKKLKKVPGITDASASLADNSVTINVKKGSPIYEEVMNDALYEYGYSVDQIQKSRSFDQITVVQTIVILIVFALAYLILEDTGLLASITLSESSTVPAFFGIGVIASLSSCAALVGGILLSMSKQWNSLYGGKDEEKRVLPFVLFNAGRLVAFALLGGLLGMIGSFFQISLQMTAVLVIAVSFVMVIVALQMLGVSFAQRIRLGFPRFLSQFAANEKNFQGKYMPFAAGAATFFLPCGFTLMAQTIALASGSFLAGAVMMSAFALGTLPMLLVLSFSSLKLQTNASFSGTFNLVVGVFLILFSLYNTNSQLNVLGLASFSDVFARSSSSNENSSLGVRIEGQGADAVQYVTMEARRFEYFPRTLELTAGIPTKLTISNYDVVGCAQAMWLGGLYDEVVYLNTPKADIEFTPEAGNYKISCTMGMVLPVMVSVR